MNQHIEIPIEKIVPNQHQPRLIFDDDAIFELAQSIQENGLIQPIVVRQNGEVYEIIAGERRYRAMMRIGMLKVPCIVNNMDDQKSAALALIENIQREDLNVYEEAKAYREILKTEKITQKELAKRLGKSQSSIANKIRLLELPKPVLDALNQREITERHARALLNVETAKVDEVLDTILDKKLNVKDTENLIKRQQKPEKPVTRGISQHIRIGINTVKRSIEMVEQTGIAVKHSIVENEDEVVITVRFPK